MSRRRRRSFARRTGGPRASTLVRRTEPVARVRLGDASDLVAIVPYLLGFVPSESVVAVLVGGGQVRLTARLDLPDLARSDVEGVEPLTAWAIQLIEAQRPDSVVLLTYSARGGPARAWASRFSDQLKPYGLTDSLLVDGTRWWSLGCTADCCPDEGTPYDLTSHPVAAAAVYAGLSVLPDRSSLAAWVAGPPDEAVDGLTDLVAEVRVELPRSRLERQRRMAELVEDYLARPRALNERECCRLAVLAEDLHVRDMAWALIEPDRATDHVALWRQVVARAVPPLESAPICLLAMAGWITGNGALMNFCLDKMADLDPDYTMAGILFDIVARAIPPSRWEDLRREVGGPAGVLAG